MSDQTPCFGQWWKSSQFAITNTGGYSPKQVARVVWAHLQNEIANVRADMVRLTEERDSARIGLYHRITGWDVDGQQETKAQDELQRLRDQNATLQDENARLKAELEQARFAAQADTAEIAIAHEAANLLATKLATLKDDADRREREAEEPLDEISSAVDDIETIAQGIHTRLMSDDVPWSVASEVDGEFSLEFERVEKRLKHAHRTLTQVLTQRQEQ